MTSTMEMPPIIVIIPTIKMTSATMAKLTILMTSTTMAMSRIKSDVNNDDKVDLPGDIGALAALQRGKTKSPSRLRISFIAVLSSQNHHPSGRFGLLTAIIRNI